MTKGDVQDQGISECVKGLGVPPDFPTESRWMLLGRAEQP
jgi:hypothetical protein